MGLAERGLQIIAQRQAEAAARKQAALQKGQKTTQEADVLTQTPPSKDISKPELILPDKRKNIERFSYFNYPASNTYPSGTKTLPEIIEIIKSEKYQKICTKIRALKTKEERNIIKKNELDYVTFGGEFSYREKAKILAASGLMALDLDDLTPEQMQETEKKLRINSYVHGIFVSPSGAGLKVIVKIPKDSSKYGEYFMAFAQKIGIENTKIDLPTRDICRACFLSYDPDAYYNPDSETWTSEEYQKNTPTLSENGEIKNAVDTSRSGQEWGKICALIKTGLKKKDGLDKAEIFNTMNMFSKWKESGLEYKNFTWEKAIKNVQEKAREYEETQKVASAAQKISRIIANRKEIASELWKTNPFFYDEQKSFWFWDNTTAYYKMTDETTLLNQLDETFGPYDTISAKSKGEIIEAFKQIGRKHIPKPIKKWWVQFKNKIIDIENDMEFDATPEYFFTTSIPWDIGTTEDTPKISQYFKEWAYKEGVQNESYIDTLNEVTAYTCLNNQFLQVLFGLIGSGSNGKSTYRDVLKKFLGNQNYVSSEMKLLAVNQFETSSIYHKSICAVPEVDAYDMQNTSRLKGLAGEDPMRFCFKGKTPFTELSNCKLFVLTNSLPITPDRSIGFYRKWLIIDFPNQFTPGQKDILSDIPDWEFQNLAKKSIRIMKELKQRGAFTNGGNFDERRQRYESRSNPVEKFVNDFCDLAEPSVPIPKLEFCGYVNKYLIKKGLRIMKNSDIIKVVNGMEIRTGSKTVRDGSEVMCLSGVWVSWKENKQIDLREFSK